MFVTAEKGKAVATYDLDVHHYARFHGVRIDVAMARKSYRGECTVAVRARGA